MTLKASNYPTVRPSLDLNFAQTKRLDPRVTFSRSSSGTYFDANGVLQTAATNVARFDHNPSTGESLGLLVEEARTNNVNYSQHLALWTLPFATAVITPNAALAPDGTWTATSYVPSSGASHIRQALSSGTVTASVFAKANGLSSVRIGALGSGGAQEFNISNGTVGAASGITSASIQSCGNGWYRCTATWVQSSNNTFFIDYYTATAVPDGIKGIFLWGAQVESGSFPTSYIPTPATFTSRASSATYYDANGVIQTASTNVARSNAFFPDSNGVMRPAGLLLEAAGTNLVLNSGNWELFAVVKQNITALPNTTTAPDGATLAKELQATSTSFAVSYQIVSLTASTRYTLSVYAKAGTHQNAQLRLWDGSFFAVATFNLSTGTSSGGSIEKLPNGWFRCSVSGTAVSSTAAGRAYFDFENPVTTSSSLYYFGAQLEASPYPTSYIPTTTATVTRSADVSSSATVTRSADVATITGTSFSNWWNASTGTFQASFRSTLSGTRPVLSVDDNTANNRIELYTSTSSQKFAVTTGGAAQADITAGTASSTAINRQSAAYGTNDFSTSLTGATAVTDTSGTVPVVTQLRIGADQAGNTRTSPIARLTYWPTRLSNATLQAITR